MSRKLMDLVLGALPAEVAKIVVGVTIYEAEKRRQHFGQVSNAFMRLIDESNNQEVVRYDLSEDYSTETALIFGELYRHKGEWKFKAIGQGYAGGLHAMAVNYGINIT
jgi:tellurium resistance protein TerD